jgi:hypothetical protein
MEVIEKPQTAKDLGIVDITPEDAKSVEEVMDRLDDMGRIRVALLMLSNVLKVEKKAHPLVLMTECRLLQDCEIMCAKLKMCIAETPIGEITCNKCGKCIPSMSVKQHLEGFNAKCPHTDFEFEIKK